MAMCQAAWKIYNNGESVVGPEAGLGVAHRAVSVSLYHREACVYMH